MNSAARVKLNVAFRLMRKEGLIARQNFSCCGSCASFEIATEVSEMSPKKRGKVVGVCTYNRQAAGDLYGREPGVYLQYGPVHTREHGPVGLSDIEVGRKIVGCLLEAGLECDWDGDPAKKIWVDVPND